MVEKLNKLVADFTVFYQKLRHYHWNVKGVQFFQLHEKFEEVYTEVGDQIDLLAERIVGLDGVPLHTLADMLETSSLEEDGSMPSGSEMVARIVADIEAITESVSDAQDTAEAADDSTTVNLLDEINDALKGHQWMLKAWQG